MTAESVGIVFAIIVGAIIAVLFILVIILASESKKCHQCSHCTGKPRRDSRGGGRR